MRFTKGVAQSGLTYECQDDWLDPTNAHKTLDESWVACTTFVVQPKVSLFDVQLGRSISTVDDSTMDVDGTRGGGASMVKLRWAEIFSDE